MGVAALAAAVIITEVIPKVPPPTHTHTWKAVWVRQSRFEGKKWERKKSVCC